MIQGVPRRWPTGARVAFVGALAVAILGISRALEPVPQARGAVPMAKEHETALSSGQEFFAGSTAALRCEVRSVKSLTDTAPIPGAEVAVELKAEDGKVYPLAKEQTGSDGVAQPRFRVPDVPAGQYLLVVATRSDRGRERLERTVRVKDDAKVLLVSDKPLYQPGQVMHLRALALQAFNLRPVADKEIVFEVEDAKGNKVFKRALHTSEYGVAAVDFQLADEVNLGDYRVRALLDKQQADKTVAVKRYVLPKFKSEVTADKRYYLPREVLRGELQTDYFFGKPVAHAKVKVIASTFDVQFKEFQTWDGTTDDRGHASFEIKLPDYFVGLPLQAGDALVRLETKVTDTADHTEAVSKTYPVSDQPIRVSLIPEGGRLMPGVQNRIYAAAVYPDGAPASCTVKVWTGKEPKGKPLDELRTNEVGLAEFFLTPKADQFRQAEFAQRTIEMAGGQSMPVWGPKIVFDAVAEAKDDKGNTARQAAELTSEPLGENVLLRLDRAIYRAGDTMKVEALTSAGLPTVYLDFVRNGQVLLTEWLDVKDGKASRRLDLPPEATGTLEVHAYQMLSTGEIIRDSRVVYVQPRDGLEIDVRPDKSVYQPGEAGRIRFRVTDAEGKPAAAALGVIVVDEAVYALQELQPGLEKVYFTLQEELLKPQVEIHYRPEPIQALIQPPALPPQQQQAAQVLLTAVRPKPPARWEVAPDVERRQQVEGQIQQIGWALYNYAYHAGTVIEYDPRTKHSRFKEGLLAKVPWQQYGNPSALKDPFGNRWTLEALAKVEPHFTADRLGRAVTAGRIQQLLWIFLNYAQSHQNQFLDGGKWSFPEGILRDAARGQGQADQLLHDAWGRRIKLVTREKKWANPWNRAELEYHELASAGPDGKFGTDDDVKLSDPDFFRLGGNWWFGEADQAVRMIGRRARGGFAGAGGALGGVRREMLMNAAAPMAARAEAAGAPMLPVKDKSARDGLDRGAAGEDRKSGGAPATRVREFFPETMLWQPALITNDQGVAELPLSFADSITTWRLSASASSRGGLLGGVSAPLRVFQDFFADIDLPVSLTQNDEVAFPVAVYNYLKSPQTVKLELAKADWFELNDSAGWTRTLDLRPNEVTSVKFRIRAKKIGYQPLTVRATGSKLSDAVKRSVEVVPDGKKVEQVVTDRLQGRVHHVLTIPDNAIPDASKLVVKVYPGVMSQVLEGAEGLLRLPGG